uniref:COP9 signalosome complex subunit 9 n=1 Tax=Stegastes partitus TaxID=144197 RepID=A0A3B5AEY2_9TELE
ADSTIEELYFVPLGCMVAVWQAGGSTGLLMDLPANRKTLHIFVFCVFDDMFENSTLSTN